MSNITLPPLPNTSWTEVYSEDQMRAYATAAVLAEREKCAELFRALERSDQSVADHIEAAVLADREARGEPVAWMADSGTCVLPHERTNETYYHIPLYTHPQPVKAQSESLRDCRTCRNHNSGACVSVLRCVDGAAYQRWMAVRLWEKTC